MPLKYSNVHRDDTIHLNPPGPSSESRGLNRPPTLVNDHKDGRAPLPLATPLGAQDCRVHDVANPRVTRSEEKASGGPERNHGSRGVS